MTSAQALLLTLPPLRLRNTDFLSSLGSRLVSLSPSYRGVTFIDRTMADGTIASSASSVSPNSPKVTPIFECEGLPGFK